MVFTETISQESDSSTGESNSNPAEKPPVPSRRPALAWIAVVGACLAVVGLGLVTLGGGSSNDESDLPSWRDSARAEEIERQAHLDGQARTYRGAETPASEQGDGDGFVPGSRRMPV
jgi:hypothetical protein